MKSKKGVLSVTLTLIIVLTTSVTTCATSSMENSIIIHENTDFSIPTPNYKFKYTFKPTLVSVGSKIYQSILF